jgi:copper chaperone CopZ
MKKNNKRLIGVGLFTAIAASLCCITPVLAFVAGVSGMAATFSWLDPLRPYFITLTALVLGFAWYQKLRPRKVDEVDCDCDEVEKPSYWHSKKFLGIITVFAAFMITFPYYSGIFFPENENTPVVIQKNNIIKASLSIEGMTCKSCEHHVNHVLNFKNGVIEASSSYQSGTAFIMFDSSKVSLDELVTGIEKETGYTVIEKRLKND